MEVRRHRGVIIEWKAKSPFGFAEADEGRVFLHISNFVERARWPEAGDAVSFEMGRDPNGRPCAAGIVLHASGSVLRWSHLLELGLLLGLPALALVSLAEFISLWWVGFCVAVTSGLAWTLLWADKRYAIAANSRVPEATLHLFEISGGWPGSFVGQRMLRHKISKSRYQLLFWSIVLAHELFALDLIFGGLLYNGLQGIVEGFSAAAG